jgi:hypothetical protein
MSAPLQALQLGSDQHTKSTPPLPTSTPCHPSSHVFHAGICLARPTFHNLETNTLVYYYFNPIFC